MIINTPISLGELYDKISILNIKKQKIDDENKRKLISDELRRLYQILDQYNLKNGDHFLSQLEEINLALWEIEDKIRICESNRDFGASFVDLARMVYLTNDKRFLIKKRINEYYGSVIQEVKSHDGM